MSKYKMDLSKIKDVPGCRHNYKAGDSYCALGKLLKSVDIEPPIKTSGDYWTEDGSNLASDFFSEMMAAGMQTGDIVELNDPTGDFQKNHEAAVDMAILGALRTGLVELVEEKEKVSV